MLEEIDLTKFKNVQLKEKTFNELVDTYKERLYWYIRKIILTHDDTDDVLQNVFIKVWFNIDNFRNDSNLYTWLHRIATNESINYLNKKKKYKAISLDNLGYNIANNFKQHESVDIKAVEWKLQLAIQTLPKQQKLIFLLRYYEGFSFKEIGEIIHISIGGLKSNYHQAFQKIKNYLIEK